MPRFDVPLARYSCPCETGSGAGVNAVASALNEMRTNQGAQLTSRAGTLRIGSSSYEATDQDGAINVSRVEI
ncbi:hypothetical protein A5638_12190 [Mycolicibacterium fortuitum]|nr:hypothetical protein A5638_12190 [Mycolicibacterium fortuitum]